MSDLAQAIRAVEQAPEGPAVGAFFDLDGTLVKGFTAIAFLREDLKTIGARALFGLARDVRRLRAEDDGDLKIIERAAQVFGGRTVGDIDRLSKRVFKKRVASTLRPGARELVNAHLRRGHTVAMATAATPFQAAPVARDLNIPHLLSTRVEVVDGRLTGRLEGRPRWGREKAQAVADFAGEHGVELAESFAYGNGHEDQAFLESVGRPAAVCPDRRLARFAKSAGVPVLRLDDPPSANVRSVLGTVFSIATLNAGLGIAVAGKMVSGGRWKPIGPALAAMGDLSLQIAGIHVHVRGREYLDAARPAVFVINHQSNLDPVVVGTLLRRDFTGVGKQELASDPRAFAMGWLDVALIDRRDAQAARASLQALVQRIRDGESVAIWPEGTRMPTIRLGRFKKGAFHLAMDAGVPIVPIVLRNTGERCPQGRTMIYPGTVDVCVLPPIATDGWTKEQLNDHIADVRDRFERTLESWPDPN